MSLDAVSKIEILCHSSLREAILQEIESSGNVHLIDLSEKESTDEVEYLKPVQLDTGDLADRISSLEKALQFLEDETSDEKKKHSSGTMSIPQKELEELIENRELIEQARRAWFIAIKKAKLEGAEKELEQESEFLTAWKKLPIPLEDLRRDRICTLTAGTLEKEAIRIAHDLEDENPLLHIEIIDRTDKLERVVIAAHESVSGGLLHHLGEQGFNTADFGTRKGTTTVLLGEVERELEFVRRKMDRLHSEAQELSSSISRFKILVDAAGLTLERLKASGSACSSRHVTQLKAWIRSKDLDEFKKRVASLGEVSVEEIKPDDGETPPSPVTEKFAAQPYSLLTEMYGQPTRQDPDPTPLMAPFYALFFGICVGDAGYGFALAIGAAAGWFIVRRRHGNPRLFQLLFQGGIASILVGIFLGGWFGIQFSRLPAILQAPAGILNSLVPGYSAGGAEQGGFSVSKQFLYLTLALGLVQLSAGIVINLVKRWKSGDRIGALIDQSGWLLATAGLFPWLFNHYLLKGALYNIDGPLDGLFLIFLAVGSLLIFIMGGREASGFGKIGLGAYAMYGIVNLLGDVLSYSRLFALALSSAIIAQVINQIAGMLVSELGIPVVGVILASVVVVGGHLFNLAMAALSGFIHTARLQFVEFFGKFYDGTGVPFRPLRFQPRYIHIERDKQTDS